MKNPSQSFWARQHKIYKEAIKEGKNLCHVLPANPYVIKFISGPTKEQQLSALLSEPRVLKYINGPDEYAAIRAIKLEARVIKYVARPTEEMWLYALTYEPNLVFKAEKVTWKMFETVFNRVKGLNKHKGLDPAMRTALIMVS